jgi:hypothetical protein
LALNAHVFIQQTGNAENSSVDADKPEPNINFTAAALFGVWHKAQCSGQYVFALGLTPADSKPIITIFKWERSDCFPANHHSSCSNNINRGY